MKAFDTETSLIVKRGKATQLKTPKLICLSTETEVMSADDGVAWFIEQLESDVHLVAHNTAFDVLVLAQAAFERGHDISELLFAAYEASRIHDTLINEKLLGIESGRTGGLGLAALVKKYFGETIDGKSGPAAWRLRYNELDGVPIDEWPQAAYDYALLDSVWAGKVWKAQKRTPTEAWQTAADFCLQLAASHGLMIDRDWALRIDGHYAKIEEELTGELTRLGIMVDGVLKTAKKKEVFREAWASIGEEPMKTRTGQVSTSKDAMQELEAKGATAPEFQVFRDYLQATKFRSTYLEPILDADDRYALSPRYNVLVDTGRTSSSAPNVQNFPARLTEEQKNIAKSWGDDEKRVQAGVIFGPDIRGCFVPRPGHVFVACDYKALEMATLAQVCYNLFGGLTALGQAINNGDDLHLRVVASMMRLPYEEVERRYDEGSVEVDAKRQIAKIANYAFPTGAAVATFRSMARAGGTDVSVSQAEVAREDWFKAWPEIGDYHRFLGSLEQWDGSYWVNQHGPQRKTSGWRVRKCWKFTEAANTLFQGLAADGAKLAIWLVTEACYRDKNSVLYGARIGVFVHDEICLEVKEEKAEEAGKELSRLMEQGMKVFCPDILIEAPFDPKKDIMKRWRK